VGVDESSFVGAGGVPDVVCDVTELAPGETAHCEADYVAQQEDVDEGGAIDDVAVGFGMSLRFGMLYSPPAEAESDLVLADPELTVESSFDHSGDLVVGDQVVFHILGTNTGNVTLHDVGVSETAAGFSGSGPEPAIESCEVDGVSVQNGSVVLAPGQQVVCDTAPYTVTDADVVAGTAALVMHVGGVGVSPTGSSVVATEVTDEVVPGGSGGSGGSGQPSQPSTPSQPNQPVQPLQPASGKGGGTAVVTGGAVAGDSLGGSAAMLVVGLLTLVGLVKRRH